MVVIVVVVVVVCICASSGEVQLLPLCCGMFSLHGCAFVLGLAPSCIAQGSVLPYYNVQVRLYIFQAAVAHGDTENWPLSC